MENSNGDTAPFTGTPSRLRPPRVRSNAALKVPTATTITSTNASITAAKQTEVPTEPIEASTAHQKPRLNYPRTTRVKAAKPILPAEIPQQSIAGDRMVKTYKTLGSATSRPAPVTKAVPRGFSRTAASGRNMVSRAGYDPLSSIVNATGTRPVWDKSVKIHHCHHFIII